MQKLGRLSRVSQSIVALLLSLSLVVLTSCTTAQPPHAPTQIPVPPLTPSPALRSVSPTPQVDARRLFQHIAALNFERYTDRDRARSRDYLTQVLREAGWEPQLQTFENGGVNLVADRAGYDPQAGTILVSAHYDTVPGSPGADDNASAVASVLEVARLLGPRQTRRPLRLVFFDREEAGLKGSIAYVDQPENLRNLESVINLEMMGYACYTVGCQKYPDQLPIQPTDRGNFLGVIVDQEHAELLRAFDTSGNSTLPPVIGLPVPLKGLLTPDLLRSDHAPFWAKNIGAVMVADTANFRNPNYHQPTDTPETLDRRFLAGSAQIVLNALTTLLDRSVSSSAG